MQPRFIHRGGTENAEDRREGLYSSANPPRPLRLRGEGCWSSLRFTRSRSVQSTKEIHAWPSS